MPIRIAIIGFGKIARDQHLPAIASHPGFELVAVVTPSKDPEVGVPWFASHAELFDAMAGRLDAVAICTPPTARHDIAGVALTAGHAVLLEKPPAATLGEVDDLEAIARRCGRTLYASWHSQHAPAVAPAAEALAGKRITGLRINWFENVRKWHAGQEWIWAPGGFGVFDPGINALSIATRLLPIPLFVREASLLFPANKQAPIAARIGFDGEALSAEMDWRYTDGECWTIAIETSDGGCIELCDGGFRLLVDGEERLAARESEYGSIYSRFAALIETGQIEVDREPLRIVADAFLVGRRELVEPFL